MMLPCSQCSVSVHFFLNSCWPAMFCVLCGSAFFYEQEDARLFIAINLQWCLVTVQMFVRSEFFAKLFYRSEKLVGCNTTRRLCDRRSGIAHNIAYNVTYRQHYVGGSAAMFAMFGFCAFFCEQLLTCNVHAFVRKCVFSWTGRRTAKYSRLSAMTLSDSSNVRPFGVFCKTFL